MADEQLKLNNRTLGESVDEYIGGSFFYSEGIDVLSNSKCFKLGPSITETNINRRTNSQGIAICNIPSNTPLIVSSDGFIENQGTYNALVTSNTVGGAIYKRASTYYNATSVGSTLYGVSSDKVDVIKTPYSCWNVTNLIANPTLNSNTSWGTGTGWTFGANGATHTSGTTALQQTLSGVSGKGRLVVKITGWTEGTLQIQGSGVMTDKYGFWYMNVIDTYTDYVFEITPSSGFNGTIQYVGLYQYDLTKVLENHITITSGTEHPLLVKGGFLYIGSGSYVDIIDLSSNTLYKTVNLLDIGYTIKSITNVGNNIIIWGSNGQDSKQYYRDGIGTDISESVEWNGMDITNAISDGALSYVITGGQSNNQRVYVVSGYSRQLLARNKYNGYGLGSLYGKYNPSKKFNFYNYNQNCLKTLNDKLYVGSYGGIYVYGYNIPGMKSSWSKNIIHSTDGITTPYAIGTYLGEILYSYKKTISGVIYNTIGVVKEYGHNGYGYLVSNPLLRDNLSTEKGLDKAKIGFKNVDSSIGNIKIYAIVDDNYFWTYNVYGVGVSPTAGAIYSISPYITLEVISTNIVAGDGTILFKTKTNTFRSPEENLLTLTKVSGTGDSEINSTSWTNMALIKTITSTKQDYSNELIFGKAFIDTHMPNWHKLQLVVELTSNNTNVSPEVYDIDVLATPVKVNV